jgi:flavin reductase (DIM6/NTAB) family NADH-FMN oxidoreductase RutF
LSEKQTLEPQMTQKAQKERSACLMKHEFGPKRPECLVEDWPGKYGAFPWLEYVATLPNPIFLVTTRKANGASNASLQSWGLLLGGGDTCISLLAILKHQHTCANILREREWCLNYPDFAHYPPCFETLWCNGPENDEIADAGLTLEPGREVRAPRIGECLINLECRLEREQELFEGAGWHLFFGRVVHAAFDERALAPEPEQRMREMQLIYNIRSTVNPLDGSFYGPNTLGLLKEVVKIFPEGGGIPEWKSPAEK